jgi:hypothetical protein
MPFITHNSVFLSPYCINSHNPSTHFVQFHVSSLPNYTTMSTANDNGDAGLKSYAPACVDMIGVFTSCTSKIDGFTTLGVQEQASCYWLAKLSYKFRD